MSWGRLPPPFRAASGAARGALCGLGLAAALGAAPPTPCAGGWGGPLGPAVGWPPVAVEGRALMEQVAGGCRLRVAWPGVALRVAFVGSGLSVGLEDLAAGAAGEPSQWRVWVDGRPVGRLQTPPGGGRVVLAEGLPEGPHVVRLARSTEALLGSSRIWDLIATGAGAAAWLPAPPPRPHRLEVLGASNETGYGVGATDCAGYRAHQQDEALAWPRRLADALDAELMNTSFSGKGLLRNHPAAGPIPLPALARRVDPALAEPRWDPARYQPELVLIDLGGNDWAGFGGRPPPRASQRALVALLARLRAHYPEAQLGVTLNAAFAPPRRQLQARMLRAAVAERRAAGDRRTHFFAFRQDRSGPRERGCDGHPSAATHAAMAAEILPWARRLLGAGPGDPAH